MVSVPLSVLGNYGPDPRREILVPALDGLSVPARLS